MSTDLQAPEPFLFVFPHGRHVWSSEMTREELMHVISHLKRASDYYKNEAIKNLELASL